MNQAQKDFAEGIRAYSIGISGRSRSPNFYRGWHWAWGNKDSREGKTPIYSIDKDYAAGYANQLTDLHHEHPTPEGDRSPEPLTI